jgi:hypothetical protein
MELGLIDLQVASSRPVMLQTCHALIIKYRRQQCLQ